MQRSLHWQYPVKEISWQDFEQVELHTGTIIDVHSFPEARKPAWKLVIDFGKHIGIKKSSAQITDLYSKQELMGKQIIAVTNFPPKQIGPFISECLVTGFTREDGSVILASPDKPTANGIKLS
jgi:tRNA-binding protein